MSSSAVFVHSALTQLATSKDAKRLLLQTHEQSMTQLLEMFKSGAGAGAVAGSEREAKLVGLLKELAQLATQNMAAYRVAASTLLTAVLDLISKIIQDAHYASHLDDMTHLVANLCDTNGANNTFALSNLQYDDRVLLQIFKALQVAVTNNTSHLHNQSMLLAIRTVYNIYLFCSNAKKSNIQSIAHSTLSQMIQSVFTRVRVQHHKRTAGDVVPPSETYDQFMHRQLMGTPPLSKHQSNTAPLSPTSSESPRTAKTDVTTLSAETDHSEDFKEVGDTPALVISEEIVNEVIDAAVPPSKSEPLEKPLPEAPPVIHSPPPSLNKSAATNSDDQLDLLDAYVLFRALCRLSLKALPGSDSTQPPSSAGSTGSTGMSDLLIKKDPTYLLGLKSKILSLELLSMMVRDHANVLCLQVPIVVSGEQQREQEGEATSPPQVMTTSFVHAVKFYLCSSLLTNAASFVPDVFERSYEIFVFLVQGMRHLLKKEMEVFFQEIVLAILEPKSTMGALHPVTYHQKLALINMMASLFSDPRVLVEMYLNYDCDDTQSKPDVPNASGIMVNSVYETIVSFLGRLLVNRDLKFLQTAPAIPGLAGTEFDSHSFGTRLRQQGARRQNKSANSLSASSATTNAESTTTPASNAMTPSPSTTKVQSSLPDMSINLGQLVPEKAQSLKFRGLEALASILNSLVVWSRDNTESVESTTATEAEPSPEPHTETSTSPQAVANGDADEDKTSTPDNRSDLSRFEQVKQQKKMLKEGIDLFNWKPNKGIKRLLENGLIQKTPDSISKFLLNTPGLSKKMIGEYLGEGEEFNISVMHAFVNHLDFSGMKFVEGLRHFLQKFRLPGEAQKIDRFMLKFAERYLLMNPKTFPSADSVYVLAYSVIMLNTDAHSPQVKKRMTLDEFIRNNRGMADGQDFAREMLTEIFDDIHRNEIKMKDEEEQEKSRKPDTFANLPFQPRKEAWMMVAEEVASTISGAAKGTVARPFHVARYSAHAKSMVDLVWMSVLTGVSAAFQEIDMNDAQSNTLALATFRSSIILSATYSELSLARNAFVSTLCKMAYFNVPSEFITKPRQLLSIQCLLECGYFCGDGMGDAWGDILRCTSALERAIGKGGGNETLGPVVAGVGGIAHTDPSTNVASNATAQLNDKKMSRREPQKEEKERILTQQEVMQVENICQSLLIQMDRIFTSSKRLSGAGIVEFVRWLCVVSWEEIQQSTSSSPLSTVPRMFMLTKLVEISYYNMGRIRIEWSNIWAILGEHFNQVGCHPNQHVAFFSVDSLRQLSMKFLEKEELSNFRFQKDFLKPFEHIVSNNASQLIKDMVLRCIHQLIQAKGHNIKSGWKTLLGVLNRAAKDTREPIVTMAFDILKSVQAKRFNDVFIANRAFADYMGCLVSFAQNQSFPKVNLQSVELIHVAIPKIVEVVEKIKEGKQVQVIDPSGDATDMASTYGIPPGKSPQDDPILALWFPLHFGLYEIIMSCDLEVRTRALQYLFETLRKYGGQYTTEFWEVISRGVIFPIFDDLRLTGSEKRKFENKEDMAVWLNTTLIQALRQLVDLITFWFDLLEKTMLEGVLELIKVCFGVPQENETIAKIGSSCLQQLVENNIEKLRDEHWDKICNMVADLFESASATSLFEPEFMKEVLARAGEKKNQKPVANSTDVLTSPSDSELGDPDEPRSAGEKKSAKQLKREFQQIIIKSVIQLIVIQTANDLLHSKTPVVIYSRMKSVHIMRLLRCLHTSYSFARKFNADVPFRMALYRIGFMNQLPNLLRQETNAVQALLSNIFRMHADAYSDSPLKEDRSSVIKEVESMMREVCTEVIRHYISLDASTKQRNITAWSPVILAILEGLMAMPDDKFRELVKVLYALILGIIKQHDATGPLKAAIYQVLARTDKLWGISMN